MPRRYPSQLRLLVVENNPLLLRALRDMLELWGVGQVVAVTNGLEAQDLLRREPFDLMVTDWMMEPVGGSQLVEWVRQSPACLSPDLPVIVLTANADLATVRAAWDAGADSVLAKPASAATIARRIETVLTRPRRARPDTRTEPRAGAAPDQTQTDRPTPAKPPREKPAAAAPRPVLPPVTPPAAPALPGGPSPLRLPPPGPLVRAVEPKRVRLTLALDRLEAALEKPDAMSTRLRHAVSDLQLAATGNAAATTITASLSTCVTWVDHDSECFAEAARTHLEALRWLAASGDGPEAAVAAHALVRALRAMVRTLTLRDATDPGLWPGAGSGNVPGAIPGPGDLPLPPA